MAKKTAAINQQSGQTLVETLVAVFVLVVGLVTALGLAISSFQSTSAASYQVIGTALARQGAEIVKNIRDTNWLQGTLSDCSGSYGTAQSCYPTWANYNGTAMGSVAPGTNYAVDLVTTGNPILTATPTTYALNYLASSNSYVSAANFAGQGVASIYSRKVNIIQDSGAPYNIPGNYRLIITSTVWWSGRNCPATTDPTTLPASCKVILEMHLTNWRNY